MSYRMTSSSADELSSQPARLVDLWCGKRGCGSTKTAHKRLPTQSVIVWLSSFPRHPLSPDVWSCPSSLTHRTSANPCIAHLTVQTWLLRQLTSHVCFPHYPSSSCHEPAARVLLSPFLIFEPRGERPPSNEIDAASVTIIALSPVLIRRYPCATP